MVSLPLSQRTLIQRIAVDAILTDDSSTDKGMLF